VEVGVGGELVARGPAADEDVEVGRFERALARGYDNVRVKLCA
jgi:hypothetical protein